MACPNAYVQTPNLSKLLTLWLAQQSCLSNLGRQFFWLVWLGPMVACPILVQSSQAARAMWPSQVARLGLSDFDSSNVACPISVSLQPRWPVQTPNPLAGPAILPVQSWPCAILACPFLVCLARPDGCLSNFAFIQFCLQMLPVQFRCVQFRYLWLAQQSCLSNFGCPILACPGVLSGVLSGGLSRWPVPVACPNSFVTKLLRMPVAVGLVLAWRLSNLDGPIWMLLGLAPVQTGFTNWNHGQTGSPTGFFQCFAADGAGPLGKSPGFG